MPSAATPHAPAPEAGSAEIALARGPVVAALATLAIVLAASNQFYGYHRDELYFRMLPPQWGYVDQPPLTPLLAQGLSTIVDEPWMLRMPALVAAVATVFVLVLIAREAGGGRRAQTLAAWASATASFVLVSGHVLLSASIDTLAWVLVGLFALRAVLRDEPRWWLWVGFVAGLASYNKLLVAVLVIGIALGLAAFGPRKVFAQPLLWAGAAIALALAVPNLVYQAVNEWPQLRMGAALSANNADEVRIQMWMFLVLLVGPPLVPIWIAGIVALFRRPALRAARFAVVAFATVIVFTFVGGTQPYYPLGVVLVLLAIGCVPTAEWMRVRWRAGLVWAGVALNAVASALIVLPVIPVSALGSTPIPVINQATADSVGWPRYVEQIAAVVRSADGDPVVVTSNYGEAGAIARFGPEFGIGDVAYSGHNELAAIARPPESATAAVFVGGIGPVVQNAFEDCVETARLDNGVGVDNEEQGVPIVLCAGLRTSWAELWPQLTHLD